MGGLKRILRNNDGCLRGSIAWRWIVFASIAGAIMAISWNGVLAQEEPSRPKVVAILPGHGGRESGAVHQNQSGEIDLIERDVNLAIARRLAARLVDAGYVVVLTRDGDFSLTPNPGDAEREVQAHLDVANSANADILVSIHNNGHPDSGQSGTEVYYCPKREFSDKSRRLAEAVQKHIVSGLWDVAGYPARDRGGK